MRITVQEAQAWAQGEGDSKLTIGTLNAELLNQVEVQVLSALSNSGYDTSTWTNDTTTPKLVRSIIAMLYVAWLYDKAYSEDVDEGNAYAALLRGAAQANIAGILDGTFTLDGAVLTGVAADSPSFYPTDNSSRLSPTDYDSSLGPAAFSMGQRF